MICRTDDKTLVSLSGAFLLVFIVSSLAFCQSSEMAGEQGAATAPTTPQDSFETGMAGTPEGEKGLLCDQERCQRASKAFIVQVVMVDLVLLILGFAVWFWIIRKGWLYGFVSFAVVGLVAAAIATAIVAIYPFATEVYKCCMGSNQYAKYIIFSDLSPFAKGFALAGAPVFLLLFLAIILKKLLWR